MTYLRLARRRQPVLKTIIIWAFIMVPISAMLYSASTRVRALENELASVNAEIALEKDALRVLKAEWAYLNQPQRLASRAGKYLKLNKPAAPLQVAAEEQLPLRIAFRPAPEVVVAEGIAIAPSQQAKPLVFARPIAYEENTLSSLHDMEGARLPAASTWTQKVVSAIGMTGDALRGKNRAAP